MLTPWFSPKEKPVRNGVYIISTKHPSKLSLSQGFWPAYAHWNGEYWSWPSSSIAQAKKHSVFSWKNLQQGLWFRGIDEEEYNHRVKNLEKNNA